MASTFRPLNTTGSLASDSRDDEMSTDPGTPTPTRTTFSQRPLPSSPFPQAIQIPESIEENKEMQHSDRKSRGDSEDADMDEDGQESDGSDDESVNADGTRSGKKKKSQRFYCTDYPPCNLSFTRSEHLARHIRYVLSDRSGFLPFQVRDEADASLENTLGNDRSSVTARGGSRASTTFDNTRRLCMSTRIYP